MIIQHAILLRKMVFYEENLKKGKRWEVINSKKAFFTETTRPNEETQIPLN